MNILSKIIGEKSKEVKEKAALFPVKLLEKSIYFEAAPVSLKKYLLRQDKTGIIAEIKRRSPSKGDINPNINVERVSIGYMQAGASALSVLTDEKFFGGSSEDLMQARKYNYCPILRKDFIIEEYQIIEAKSIGADAILLIAACLDNEKVTRLSKMAAELGMEVLIEVHGKSDITDTILKNADLIGVNNRNLEDFSVDITTSLEMAKILPEELLRISESGIDNPESLLMLKQHGYAGFLIGENFMRHYQPEKACRDFVARLRILQEGKKTVKESNL